MMRSVDLPVGVFVVVQCYWAAGEDIHRVFPNMVLAPTAALF